MQGATEGGRQVKKRSLSSVMCEGEELTSLLTIHQTEKAVFKLTVAQSEPRKESKDVDSDQDKAENCPEEASAALEAYRAQFSDPSFASEVTLKYQLAHTDGHDSRFDQLFSIRFHFSLTDNHYEKLHDISVPCLFRERPSPIVQLKLKPRQPYPTTLHASAIYTTQDGLSWHTAVPDIHVAFEQTFMPLPSPQTRGQGGKLSVFEGLWEEMCIEEGENAISLFCCQLEEAALNALVGKHFLPYLVSDPSHKEEFKVLFFLPPQYHILLKIMFKEDAVHFNIATDNWQLLPHIGSYLLTITAAQGLPPS